MARPKENIILSEAFEQKCQREKEKLKLELKRNLKEDIIRLLTEEIHPDVIITDGVDTVPGHLFILQARAKRLFGILKLDLDKGGSIEKINIPWSSCRKLEDFVKQLYYTENVNSLIDDIDDSLKHKTRVKNNQNIDDFNHNTCYTNHETSLNLESNIHDTSEIHLSDVHLQETVNSFESCEDHWNSNGMSNSNSDSRNRDTLCDSEKENVADDNMTSSVPNDTNLPDLIKLSYSLTLPHQCCSSLGEDLLRAFLQDKGCDCSLVVAGQQFKAHRCILAARSEYFEAMLGGQWKESGSQTIELEGVNPGAVEQALLFLYGGVIDIIETCNVPDLLVVGDMYGMIGLKHASSFLITKDYCHFFHKPCSLCLTLAGDALTLAVTYNLQELQDKCIKWINKYFTKFWSSRSFASQHEDILKLCCDQLISQISEQNVVDMIMDSHKLQGNIPHVKWAEPILHLTSQLMAATIQFISNNFISIMGSKQFLGWEKGAAWNVSVLEDIFGQVIESVSPSNGCKIYQALLRLDEYNESLEDCSGREDLHEFVKYLLKKCETFLRINIHQVTLTEDWSVLSESIRNKILSCASYVCFDSGKNTTRKRPPKLPSSRKTNISGAVIQSLRDDHEFKKKTASYHNNGTKSKVLNTGIKRVSNRPQGTSSASTSSSSSRASTSRKNGLQKSGKTSHSKEAVRKTGSSSEDETDNVNSEEAILISVKDIKLERLPAPSPHRQLSLSPDSDRISTSSNTSPRISTRIPIFRSSSLSPYQERSRSRSPDTNPYDTGSPNEILTTSLKLQAGECSQLEGSSHTSSSETAIDVVSENPSLHMSETSSTVARTSATNDNLSSEQLSLSQETGSTLTNTVVLRKHKVQTDEMKERRWSSPAYPLTSIADSQVLKRSTSTRSSCFESKSIERLGKAKLLPLFEVNFHKPGQ